MEEARISEASSCDLEMESTVYERGCMASKWWERVLRFSCSRVLLPANQRKEKGPKEGFSF